jgi:hypothetical protein
MKDQHTPERERNFLQLVNLILASAAVILVLMLVVVIFFISVSYFPSSVETHEIGPERPGETSASASVIIDGKDKETGLIAQGDYILVKQTCTACHSSELILKANFSEEVWIEKIRWMQAKQKLWDLGSNEKPILAYLAKYYGPDSVHIAFRRRPLTDIKWYKLED